MSLKYNNVTTRAMRRLGPGWWTASEIAERSEYGGDGLSWIYSGLRYGTRKGYILERPGEFKAGGKEFRLVEWGRETIAEMEEYETRLRGRRKRAKQDRRKNRAELKNAPNWDEVMKKVVE